jgi:glyoxylase-like metal-dependent hydrolase (beta-lactamase superfamily II)
MLLVVLMNARVVGKVSNNVWLLDTGGLGHSQSVAAYLVVGSKKSVLVDSGYPVTHRDVARLLADLGFSNDILFPTHVHLDHGGGVGGLASLFKGCRIVAHERAARHIIDPRRLVASASMVYGEAGMDRIGLPEPVDKDKVESFKDEIELDLGDVTVRGFYTPGHAPHHASVLVEPDGVVITGDAISARFPVIRSVPLPVTPPPSFNPDSYFKSLELIKSLNPKFLLAPHFGVIKVYDGFFDDEKKVVEDWITRIRSLKSRGLNAKGIALVLSRELAGRAAVESIPSYVENTLRISVMGVLQLLGDDISLLVRELRPSYR